MSLYLGIRCNKPQALEIRQHFVDFMFGHSRPLFLIFVFSIQQIIIKIEDAWIRTTDFWFGSDLCTNCATTTAQVRIYLS